MSWSAMAPASRLAACRQALLPSALTEECRSCASASSSGSHKATATAAALSISALGHSSGRFLGTARCTQLIVLGITLVTLVVLIPCGSLLISVSQVPRIMDSPTTVAKLSQRLVSAGKSASGEPEGLTIVVWGASLPGNDEPTYCAVRYGEPSLWDAKSLGSSRQSAVTSDTKKPSYRLGMIAVGRADELELQVRVYTQEGSLLLAFKKPISDLLAHGLQRMTYSAQGLDNGTLQITVAQGGVAPYFRLQELGVEDCVDCTLGLQSMAKARAVSLSDIDALHPLMIGRAPLPENLQGLWWQTKQGKGGALMSFAGPNHDAGPCSRGYLANVSGKISYSIRAEGDGVWSSAEQTGLYVLLSVFDLIYHFEFDNATSPTFAQIYTWGGGLHEYFNVPVPWLAKYEMYFEEQGHPAYPGSQIWRRRTSVLGYNMSDEDYNLVQVIDASGNKLEPAWTKFVTYMNDSSKSGRYPGWLFYKSIHPSPTPGAEQFMEQVDANCYTLAIAFAIGIFAALCLLCSCCLRCCRKCKRVDSGS